MLAMEPAGEEARKQIQSIGLRLQNPLGQDHRALLVPNVSVALDLIFRESGTNMPSIRRPNGDGVPHSPVLYRVNGQCLLRFLVLSKIIKRRRHIRRN